MSQDRMHHLVFGICVVTVLLQMALNACIIPKKIFSNGSIQCQRRRNFNSTQVQEAYILHFRCNPGYTRIGPRAILCKNDECTAQFPECIKTECGEPPSISNGTYTVKTGEDGRRIIGSTATYSCDRGFELENDTADVLKCEFDLKTNDSHWSNPTPRCKEKACPDPGVSVDGARKGNCCSVGDIFKYSCKEGFELVGTDTLVCLPTGTWSAPRPLCRPLKDHCSSPPSIAHGSVIGKKKGDFYLPYEEVEITCEPGFKYQGFEFNLCFEEIGWEEEFSECKGIFCYPPESLENGSIPEVQSTNLTAFPYDFEITYVCNEGYRLIGDSWRFCSENGWSGDAPYCEEIRCPDPGVPEHGLSSRGSLQIGSKVVFDCLEGYNLTGSIEIYCMPNGQWNGEVARCDKEDNYCPNPGIPVNGMKNSSHYDMGSKIHFQCRPGYAFRGTDVIECLPNRTWSAKERKCIGPYEFDDSDRVSEILKLKVEEIAHQQIWELKNYRLASQAIWLDRTNESTTSKRIVNLNYPKRFILYFVFDTSRSITERNFRRTVEFSKAIIKKVGISEYGARIGAFTFGSNAEIAFLPTSYKHTEDVLRALDEIKYTGNGTATLTSSLEDLIFTFIPVTREVLGIREQKSIVFIFTDGRANMGGSIVGAESLKETGVEIYTIGIASYIPQRSLIQIASEPKNEHAFILQNYAVFDWLSQKIREMTVAEMSCPDPGVSVDGVREGNCCSVGDGFKYSCKEGFELVGIDTLVCLPTGKWSAPRPLCRHYSRCGVRAKQIRLTDGESRITGGQAAETWPWTAALYVPSRYGNGNRLCGGSIIHSLYILTNADCVYDWGTQERRKENPITVHLGLRDIPETKQVIHGKKLYIHEKYELGNADHDIALLKLERPIEYNSFVRPICLPPTNLSLNSTLYKPNETAIVADWKAVLREDEWKYGAFGIGRYLTEVNLTLQSKEKCVDFLKDRSRDVEGEATMLCASAVGKDMCSRNRGSPLMQPQFDSDGNIYWTQIGITGFGFGSCRRETAYGLYPHVQNLLPWITETIKQTINE